MKEIEKKRDWKWNLAYSFELVDFLSVASGGGAQWGQARAGHATQVLCMGAIDQLNRQTINDRKHVKVKMEKEKQKMVK